VGDDERDGNIARIRCRLAARKIRVVMIAGSWFQGVKKSHPQADRIHIAPDGHTKLAAGILPQVLAAIGR
jgi:lysophospholipase L1-like esterase